MKPIFILCEGPHDIAFLGRLLKSIGVKPFEEPLANYQPIPLRKFLITRYQDRDVAGGHFRSTGKNKGAFIAEAPPILEAAYRLEEPARLLLFLRCLGDQHADAIRDFLESVVELSLPGAANVGLASFGVIFVGDADDNGIESKASYWRKEFEAVLTPVIPRFAELMANAPDKIVRCGDFSAGCCVFTSSGRTTGTLEDVVWPLLYQGISARLDDAQKYVATHGVSGTEVARGKNPSTKKQKAALTIAGQIDSPGYALSVVLRDTLAFDDDLLRSDTACNTLIQTLIHV